MAEREKQFNKIRNIRGLSDRKVPIDIAKQIIDTFPDLKTLVASSFRMMENASDFITDPNEYKMSILNLYEMAYRTASAPDATPTELGEYLLTYKSQCGTTQQAHALGVARAYWEKVRGVKLPEFK